MNLPFLAVGLPALAVGIPMLIRGSVELDAFVREFASDRPRRFHWEIAQAFKTARRTCPETAENRKRIFRIYALNWVGMLLCVAAALCAVASDQS